MRQTYLVFLTFLVIIAGLLVANFRISTNTDNSLDEGVILQNLPSSYCPKEAEIYRVSRIGRSAIVPVTNCNAVSLAQLSLNNNEEVIIKLPKALAFSVSYNDKANRHIVGLRVGDVTEDNVIDEQDEALVLDNLFNTNFKADVDLDGIVTVHDLSLTRINRAVGTTRPDGKDWRL